MKFRRLALAVLLCGFCSWAGMPGSEAIRAQEMASARVLFSEGAVEIRRPTENISPAPRHQKIAFKAADELKAGDTIVTGRGGRLVLGLSDGSQAVVAPQTTVVIQDLSRSPRTLFQLLRGKTRVRIEKLGGRPNPYRVNTPTAVIAVRGTIFDVLVDSNATEVFLHEGEVVVTGAGLPDRPVLLSAGQKTRIRRERAPAPPEAFKPGRNDSTFKVEREAPGSQENRRASNDRPRGDDDRNRTSSRSPAPPDSGRNNPAPSPPRSGDGARTGGRKPQ